MINQAERGDQLKPGMTVVAATSAGTGAAIAMACALRCTTIVSPTRRRAGEGGRHESLRRGYGLPGGVPPDHPVLQNIENKLCEENPGKYYGVDQYNNPYNADAYEATGPGFGSRRRVR